MKKKAFCILLLTFIVIYVYHEGCHLYSPPKIYKPYIISKHSSDTIQVAFIGDSWALLHRNHNCEIPKLLEKEFHRPVDVLSLGFPRITSKELYKAIYDNMEIKHFFLAKSFDYCIVATGVNDTDNKMSTSYYTNSVEGIIQFLLTNHIKPIIIEIPDYDIHKSFKNQGKIKMALRYFSMFINNVPKNCKQIFRDALRHHIHDNNYDNRAIIIDYQSWNPSFEKDQETIYQEDGLHLNNSGYERLDRAIVKAIIKEKK